MDKFFRTSSLHGQTILTEEAGESRSFYGHASGIDASEKLSLAKGEFWHVVVKYFDNDLGQYRNLCLRLNPMLRDENLPRFREITQQAAGLKRYLVDRKLVGYFPNRDTEPKVEDMGLDYRRVELQHCTGWGMRPLTDHLTLRYLEHLSRGADARPDVHDMSDENADTLYPQLELTYNVDADRFTTGQVVASRGSNYVRMRIEIPAGDQLAFRDRKGIAHFYKHSSRYDAAEVREFFRSGDHGLPLTLMDADELVPKAVAVHCGNDHFSAWLGYRPDGEYAFTDRWLPTIAVSMSVISGKKVKETTYREGVTRLICQLAIDVLILYTNLERTLEGYDLSHDPVSKELLPQLASIRERLDAMTQSIQEREVEYEEAMRFFELWRELFDLLVGIDKPSSSLDEMYGHVYIHHNATPCWKDSIGSNQRRLFLTASPAPGPFTPPERSPTHPSSEAPRMSSGPIVPGGYGAWHKLLVALGLRKK